MKPVYLTEPSIEWKESYLAMIEEWRRTGESLVPYVLELDASDFAAMLKKLADMKYRTDLGEGVVNSTTFWLVDEGKQVLGAVNIRHTLNEGLLQRGGHIGYGIRPSKRRKGYATELLRQSLLKAKELGIAHALITCNKSNVASARTIIKNKGRLDSTGWVEGQEVERYLIGLADD